MRNLRETPFIQHSAAWPFGQRPMQPAIATLPSVAPHRGGQRRGRSPLLRHERPLPRFVETGRRRARSSAMSVRSRQSNARRSPRLSSERQQRKRVAASSIPPPQRADSTASQKDDRPGRKGAQGNAGAGANRSTRERHDVDADPNRSRRRRGRGEKRRAEQAARNAKSSIIAGSADSRSAPRG